MGIFIGLILSYGSSNKTEFNFCPWRSIVAWGVYVLDVSVFLLESLGCDPFLWFFWRSCSLDEFFFMNHGPLKGQVSSFPSCCINNSLMPLVLSPHQIQSSFRYVTDEVLDIWYDMSWYCWLVFLCWYCWLVFFGCIDADLVHSDVEMYFQYSGWQWVQSWNGVLSCLYLLSLAIKILLQ